MHLQDLIDQLTELVAEHGPHIEVRLATQPGRPYEHELRGVVDVTLDELDPQGPQPAGIGPEEAVVYLVEGREFGPVSWSLWDRV